MKVRHAAAGPGLGLLMLVAAACSTGFEDAGLRAQQASEGLGERGRFCLSLTRAVTAVESASPDTAQEAIEEAVTQAPEGLLTEVRAFADDLRTVHELGIEGLKDPAVQTAASHLLEQTQELCEPG